tara:strand:+ start:92 stop:259 length:168 start_codon:yes stop_codon:yes gene_type:complete
MKKRKFSKSARNSKQTIFYDNKPFAEVVIEGIIFATGTATALTILSALIIAIINI